MLEYQVEPIFIIWRVEEQKFVPLRPTPSHFQMSYRPRVALVIETSSSFGRDLLRGIRRYLSGRGNWSVMLEQRDLFSLNSSWTRNWSGDGIIIRASDEKFAEFVSKAGIPCVDLTDRHGDLGLPTIRIDHRNVGKLAAEHLLERGFRRFAYVGFTGEFWSQERQFGFCDALQGQGEMFPEFTSPWNEYANQSWDEELSLLRSWLEQLPKPIGIMACNDIRGQHLLDACQECRISVPEEVAIIGCDNDRLRCELTDPALTSVVLNSQLIGFKAAELLDQFMRSGIDLGYKELVGPVGVEVRQSTDITAIEDPVIAKAVHMIRDRALSGVTVNEIVSELPLTRSSLERGVRRYLKRSPQAEIRHVQLKHAQRLLTETDFSITEISRRCGFEHSEYFSVVFKRECHEPPSHYRSRTQMKSLDR
ncbi:XylR family transcriptional regulator [Calycomorphotria hydatis]|uniref:Xylose operon regulatory protein n=1 Tax=Calycomorphotria hydatis TaxID=2528027 RepID=A0A517T9T8_9PLAN|nr:DNA-binding transcriptional regulator [Calycomorphotria hydatis]QDT65140.1 Xylose operon regulatory protein [Calycomorphotria hydatis]